MLRTTEPATRPAAVAGMFYPADAAILRRDVATLLSGASGAAGTRTPKALIARRTRLRLFRPHWLPRLCASRCAGRSRGDARAGASRRAAT
jgi:hypothetical protein